MFITIKEIIEADVEYYKLNGVKPCFVFTDVVLDTFRSNLDFIRSYEALTLTENVKKLTFKQLIQLFQAKNIRVKMVSEFDLTDINTKTDRGSTILYSEIYNFN